jgi:serine phosphatase RsbU (regulator of sigma subunit)
VRNVALLMSMHDLAPEADAAHSMDMGEFWKHSLATASCARNLAAREGKIDSEDAWLVGILHGIGIIAMAQKVPEDFQDALLRARALRSTLAEAEIAILEFHHGELGGRILSQWHLPRVFTETVEFHVEDFEREEVSDEAFDMITLLRRAISLVRAAGFGDNGDGVDAPSLADAAAGMGIGLEEAEALTTKVEEEVCEISRLLGMECRGRALGSATGDSQRMAARLALEGLEDSLTCEALEEQLDMAREIQRRLLPESLPDLPGFELASANHPCYHISGDYYDFIQLKGGLTGMVIADVSGKGMPASLLASNLQASLRALGRIFADPGELLMNVNQALFDSTDPEHFATLFLAVMDLDGSGFRYASAGHNPPLLLKANGSADWLKPAGTPLGMFPEMGYPVTRVPMGAGDLLVAYTDGVTEAADARDTEFTEEGLEQSVRSRLTETCDTILEGVVEDVNVHVQSRTGDSRPGRMQTALPPGDDPNNRLADDLTLIVARRTD